MTFDLASAIAGFTVATIIIGGWLAVQLFAAQAEIDTLTQARDLNADDWMRERTRRIEAEARLDDVRALIAAAAAKHLQHDFPSEERGNDA